MGNRKKKQRKSKKSLSSPSMKGETLERKNGEPLVTVSPMVNYKMRKWTDMAGGEVSGLGFVRRINGGFHAYDLELFEQKCTGSETEIEGEKIAQFIDDNHERFDEFRFWWHSHHNMSVFWSGTDERTIDQLKNDPYWLSIVTNKKGDAMVRLDFTQPEDWIFNDIGYGIRRVDDDIEEEYNEKVTQKTRRSTGRTIPVGGYRGGNYTKKNHNKKTRTRKGKGSTKKKKKGNKKEGDTSKSDELDTLEKFQQERL